MKKVGRLVKTGLMRVYLSPHNNKQSGTKPTFCQFLSEWEKIFQSWRGQAQV